MGKLHCEAGSLSCLNDFKDSNLFKWNGRTQDDIMRAYDAHYIFFITYELACASENYAYREKMMKVIDRLYDQIISRWLGLQWWTFVSAYNSIDASYIDELEINVKSIQLLERLKVVKLFIFHGVS